MNLQDNVFMETIPGSSGCASLIADTADHKFMYESSELEETPSVKTIQGDDPILFNDSDSEINYDPSVKTIQGDDPILFNDSDSEINYDPSVKTIQGDDPILFNDSDSEINYDPSVKTIQGDDPILFNDSDSEINYDPSVKTIQGDDPILFNDSDSEINYDPSVKTIQGDDPILFNDSDSEINYDPSVKTIQGDDPILFNDSDSEINYEYREIVGEFIKKLEVIGSQSEIESEPTSPIKEEDPLPLLLGVTDISIVPRQIGSSLIPIVTEKSPTIVDTKSQIQNQNAPVVTEQSLHIDTDAITNKVSYIDFSMTNAPKENIDISVADDDMLNSTICVNDSKRVSKKEKVINKTNKKYKKPSRPCPFCNISQAQLKRHILTKHNKESLVVPILSMNHSDQNRHIDMLRKQAIRNYNMALLKSGEKSFMRERRIVGEGEDLPLMCSGCKGFFARKYKARHQLVCPAAGTNLMVPMVSVDLEGHYESFSSGFKGLLNTLYSDNIGNYVKSDQIILMIGARSYGSLKRKKDKVTETRRAVRARMRLIARLYLCFQGIYNNQSEVLLNDALCNAADMYRREMITILGEAINSISEKHDEDLDHLSVTAQKSGLKVSILNLLKLTGKYLTGYFLVKDDDKRSQRVVDFLKVLKLYEEELFGDAYYDLNHRKNVNLRKPINLPNNDDVQLLIEECNKIMTSIDVYTHPSESFATIRSATATCLIIFGARRGGEPVRLQLYQWAEALNGEWIDKEDKPVEFNSETMFITYQTGKGGNHLVPVLFPYECVKAMQHLTKKEIRRNAGVADGNNYIFASTKKSMSHASGWHCINDVLVRLHKKGAINATSNRHRIATILAKLELSEKEKQLIYNHFGHSERINKDVYQATPGSSQLKTTGEKLMNIHKGKSIHHSEASAPSISESCLNDELVKMPQKVEKNIGKKNICQVRKENLPG